MLIEDARRNGQHLRATWHPERRQFVLSTWSADVCTGAARLDVCDVAELTGLLVDGLADAAATAAAAPATIPATRPGLPGLVDRVRWLVRGTPPTAAPAGPLRGAPAPDRPVRRRKAAPATVHPLRRDTA